MLTGALGAEAGLATRTGVGSLDPRLSAVEGLRKECTAMSSMSWRVGNRAAVRAAVAQMKRLISNQRSKAVRDCFGADNVTSSQISCDFRLIKTNPELKILRRRADRMQSSSHNWEVSALRGAENRCLR